MPRPNEISGGNATLCAIGELRSLFLRGHRVGLCQWGELIMRRLRPLGYGSPRDFAEGFHEADRLNMYHDIVFMLNTGLLAAWDTTVSEVGNPTGGGLRDLRRDGDETTCQDVESVLSWDTKQTQESVKETESRAPDLAGDTVRLYNADYALSGVADLRNGETNKLPTNEKASGNESDSAHGAWILYYSRRKSHSRTTIARRYRDR